MGYPKIHLDIIFQESFTVLVDNLSVFNVTIVLYRIVKKRLSGTTILWFQPLMYFCASCEIRRDATDRNSAVNRSSVALS